MEQKSGLLNGLPDKDREQITSTLVMSYNCIFGALEDAREEVRTLERYIDRVLYGGFRDYRPLDIPYPYNLPG